MSRYVLECLVAARRDSKIRRWRKVEESEEKESLLALIPDGKKNDFRIVDLLQYRAIKKESLETVFSENLKKVIKKSGKTIENVAFEAGLSRQIIYDYIAGKHFPTSENLFLLCSALSCSVDEVLGTTLKVNI